MILKTGRSLEGERQQPGQVRTVPDCVQLYVAEFRRRAAGLTGDELEAEIGRMLDRIVERQLARACAH